MSIKKLFTGGKTISRKFLRKNYRQDSTFQRIMGDSEIKKVLDRPEEQRELHSMIMEKAAKGSLKGDDVRIVFDALAHKGKGEHISREEGRRIAARVFTDSSRRYKSEKPGLAESTSYAAKSNNSRSTDKAGSSSPSQPEKVSPTYSTYRAKPFRDPSNTNGAEDRKSSFSDAMRSVNRNRQSQ